MVSVWSVPLFVSAMLAAPPVVLERAPDCPSAEAISRELERIVAAPEGSAPTDTALVAAERSELRIVLATKDGQLLGERLLPAEGTCDEQARSVAVVLGAWIATAHPEYLSALPAAESEKPAGPEVPGPPPIQQVEPPAAPIPAPPPAAVAPRPEPPARVRATPRWRFQPGIAAGGELSDAGLVPAADVSLRYAPEASGFGVSAFALLAGSEVREVGGGRVGSFRWPLGVGGVGRLEVGGVAVELEAGAMLGLLRVEGEGFTTNDGATDVQGGVHGAIRAGAGSGKLRPFAAARLLAWLGQATARAELPEAEVALPAIEGVFLVGVGFAL